MCVNFSIQLVANPPLLKDQKNNKQCHNVLHCPFIDNTCNHPHCVKYNGTFRDPLSSSGGARHQHCSSRKVA